jgi:SnoaL-like domain
MESGHCAVVRAWFDTFNGRDVDAMLESTAPDVMFEPLRLLRGGYDGHDGVKRWSADAQGMLGGEPGVIAVDEIRTVGSGRVLLTGKLPGHTPFAALHEFDDSGRIVAMRHYLSDAQTMESIGLLD